MQVLSELTSLHQLNLRGCPIADQPDYQAQLLQQLPMLDVLDSKKVAKSGLPRSAKAGLTVSTKQPRKPSIHQGSDILEVDGKGPDSLSKGVDTKAKSKKRQLNAMVNDANVSAAKKAHKSKNTTVSEPEMVTLQATTSTAHKSAGDMEDADATLYQDKQKLAKKRKSKADKQPVVSDSSRSFLADVLHPEQALPPAPAAALDQARVTPAHAAAKPAAAAASGLVKVVEAAPANKAKSKKGKGSDGKASKQKAHEVSGPRAAQLLQAGLGLDAVQVGLGGSTAWD